MNKFRYMMMGVAIVLLGGSVAYLSKPSLAATPGIISYQGRVVVDGAPFTGPGLFRFALVNSTGSTTHWSNDNSSVAGAEPTVSVSLTVTNGLYSVLLGDTSITGITTEIPESVFGNTDVRLRIWFNDGENGSKLLTPDQRIVATGYALVAKSVDPSSIATAMLVDGAVTEIKLNSDAVTAIKIKNGAVTPSKLSPGAVTKFYVSPDPSDTVNSIPDVTTSTAGLPEGVKVIATAKNLIVGKYYRITVGLQSVTGSDGNQAYIRFTFGGFENTRVGPTTHGGATIDSGQSFSASRTWYVKADGTGFDFEASASGGDGGVMGGIQIVIEELPDQNTNADFLTIK